MAYGTIKVDTIENTNGQTGNAIGPGFKNRIINGAMVIDQRNAGASVTPTNGQYTVDRWGSYVAQASKLTAQQSTTAPTGFINSLLITSSSAYTVGASEWFGIAQRIEGLNISDLGWGTASAKTVTLSFWVRSSLTGTFGGSLNNSGFSYNYPFSFVINSANTWEQKTVTIVGPTSGTWLTTTGFGIQVQFSMGTGSTYSAAAGSWTSTANILSATGATSVVGTNGATFYITGVQLEVGPSATSFDYRPYGTELALCQRYYYKLKADAAYADFGSGYMSTTNVADGVVSFPVTMRTRPTALEQSGTAADYAIISASGGAGVRGICNGVPTWATATVNCSRVQFATATTFTSGWGSIIGAGNSTAGYLAWSAEL